MIRHPIQHELRQIANREKAQHLQRFFKTGPGQYAEGDQFLGITVPNLRKIVKNHFDLPLHTTTEILHSPIHEDRLAALLIWVLQFQKADPIQRATIYHTYLKNTQHVNNWDLVDSSASQIVGHYLFEHDAQNTTLLPRLALSPRLWERRIAIVATYYFIKQERFDHTLTIAEMLLHDAHDLIHKAVGWMLREVGKRNQKTEEAFLKKHHGIMPRTMLRYAIEKFSPAQRARYMKKT